MVERAAAGEEIVIAKTGQPIARLMPLREAGTGRTGGRWGKAVKIAHANGVRDLPPLHHDPFDRMLVAPARAEGLTRLTADPALARYDVPVVDATV